MRAVLVGLLMLASTYSVCANDYVVIGDDPGGEVHSFLQKYDRLRAAGTPVILDGECDSACTLVLTLPRGQVCAMPSAVLGFHGGSYIPGGPIDLAMSRKWATLYPPSVRPYFEHRELHYERASKFFRLCHG